MGALILTAYAAFTANYLFGIAVATGAVERGRHRRVHHALYFAAMAGIVAAIVVAVWLGDRRWPWLAVVGVALSLMPFFPGARRAHAVYATVCLVIYSVVFLLPS